MWFFHSANASASIGQDHHYLYRYHYLTNDPFYDQHFNHLVHGRQISHENCHLKSSFKSIATLYVLNSQQFDIITQIINFVLINFVYRLKNSKNFKLAKEVLTYFIPFLSQNISKIQNTKNNN